VCASVFNNDDGRGSPLSTNSSNWSINERTDSGTVANALDDDGDRSLTRERLPGAGSLRSLQRSNKKKRISYNDTFSLDTASVLSFR
jgi:hypothetical protein